MACVTPAAVLAVDQPPSAPATTDFVTATSTCRYLNQTGATPSAGWTSLGFDDSSWRAGRQPFGHQEPSAATDVGLPATIAYFRCSFDVPTNRAVKTAQVSVRADDGAVALLNGTEVGRFNVAKDTSANPYALRIDPYDGRKWYTFGAQPAILKPGRNTLAVQVHAAGHPGWLSSDLTMEARVRLALADPPPPPAVLKPPTPAGWRLLWSDEFNGTSVDRTRWRAYANTYGAADRHMLHCLTPDNVKVSNGTLKLIAERRRIACANGVSRDYASGFLGSRDAGVYYPLFARFEVRVRSPHGQGLFPAVWLRHAGGAGTAEVDIFEQFHSSAPGQATQTLHFPSTIGYNVAKKGTKYETAVQGRGDWHTFSVDITPVRPGDRRQARFRFAIDGKTTFEYVNTKMSSWSGSDRAWDIALQLYVGGSWAGMPDKDLGFYPAQGGICAQTSRPPTGGNPANCPTKGIWLAPWQDAVFELDYVRVYVPD